MVLLSIALLCVFLSTATRVLFFAATGIMSAYELCSNLRKIGIKCTAWVLYLYLAVHALLTLLNAGYGAYMACMAGGIYVALFSGTLHTEVSGTGTVYTASGLAYPCFLFALLMIVGISNIWLETLVIACLSTWVCDSFALIGGTRFGKHKLAPLVSPNKTVEGAICGAASSVVTGIIVYFILKLFSPIPLYVCVITAFFSSSLGQIGDLAESLLKRMIGIKDFSHLIPGHGGVFDRVDSLLYSIPTAFLCLRLAGIGV